MVREVKYIESTPQDIYQKFIYNFSLSDYEKLDMEWMENYRNEPILADFYVTKKEKNLMNRVYLRLSYQKDNSKIFLADFNSYYQGDLNSKVSVGSQIQLKCFLYKYDPEIGQIIMRECEIRQIY